MSGVNLNLAASQAIQGQPPPQMMGASSSSQDPTILNQGKMFIGGISTVTTENSLRQYFVNFGDVQDPVIMRDKETSASRGFAFITFRDPHVLDDVLQMTPHIIDGKQVDCKRAVPKEIPMQSIVHHTNLSQLQKKQQIVGKQSSVQGNGNFYNNQAQQANPMGWSQPQGPFYGLNTQQLQPSLAQAKQQPRFWEQSALPSAQSLLSQQADSKAAQAMPGAAFKSPNATINIQQLAAELVGQSSQETQQANQGQLQNFGDNSNEAPPIPRLGQPTHGASQADQKTYTAYISLQGLTQNLPESSSSPQSNPTVLDQKQAADIQKSNSAPPASKPVTPPLDHQFRKIFVGGLPHNLSDEEFKQYFVQYGEIEDCAILKDKRTGKPRGFGFVTYQSIDSLENVMSLKDSHTIQGKWVDCKRAVPAGQIAKESIAATTEKKLQVTAASQSPPITQISQHAQQVSFNSQLQKAVAVHQIPQVIPQAQAQPQLPQRLINLPLGPQSQPNQQTQTLNDALQALQYLPQAQQLLAQVLSGQLDPNMLQELAQQKKASQYGPPSQIGILPQFAQQPGMQIPSQAKVSVYPSDRAGSGFSQQDQSNDFQRGVIGKQFDRSNIGASGLSFPNPQHQMVNQGMPQQYHPMHNQLYSNQNQYNMGQGVGGIQQFNYPFQSQVQFFGNQMQQNQNMQMNMMPQMNNAYHQQMQQQQPQTFQSGFPNTQTFQQQQVQLQQLQQQQLQKLTQAAKDAGIPFEQMLAHIQQTYSVGTPGGVQATASSFSAQNPGSQPSPTAAVVQQQVQQSQQSASAFSGLPAFPGNQNFGMLSAQYPKFLQAAEGISEKEQQEQIEAHIQHLNAVYSKMSIEDIDKKNESQGAIQLTEQQLDQALSQPPLNPVIGGGKKKAHANGLQGTAPASRDLSATLASLQIGIKDVPQSQKMNVDAKSSQQDAKSHISLGGNKNEIRQLRDVLINNINEEIKQLEKSDYDYESQGNYQMRENVWHQTSGDKNNNLGGFYTHYHTDNAGLAAVGQTDSGLTCKSQQMPPPQKAESFIDIKKAYSGEDVLRFQENMKNQVYQKSTFKFINDEEYERRQNQSSINKNNDSEIRKIIEEDSPEMDHEDMFSDGGHSIKEPQEDLKKFEDLEKDKEHSSCPQMHLSSLHSVQQLPQLKRVESAGNIAEEVDEEIQLVRGLNILGSGKDLLEINDDDSDHSEGGNYAKIATQPSGSSYNLGSFNIKMPMSGQGGPINTMPKKPAATEFGHMRSEVNGQQTGPSKRADRQYKPF